MKFFTARFFAAMLLCSFIFSCEEEQIANPKVEEENSNVEYLSTKPYSKASVSLKDIPEIESFLTSKLGDSFTASRNGKNGGEVVLNEDDVLMIADTLGNKNYSFQFLHTEAPPFTFYNLIVPVDPNGVQQEPYVMSYTSEPETLDVFLQDPNSEGIDFANFTGKINVHPFEHYFPNGFNSKNDCADHDEFGDPILCDELLINNGSSSGGGTDGGSYGGPDNPAWDPYTGWSGTLIYHITPNDGTYRFKSGSVCQHPGECTIVYVYVGPNTAAQKSVTDDCIGCDVVQPGGVGVNTVPNLYAAMVNTKLDNILNVYQISFLSSNNSMTQQMLNFLNTNDNDEGKRFVYLAIQGIMEGQFTSFNSILVSDRNYINNNEVVTPFPLLKYPPHLAQQYKTQYPRLTEYLQNQIPKVANISRIVDAIHEFTTIPIEDIKRDLQWGEGPLLEIVQLVNYDENTSSDTAGHFDQNVPNKILLDIDWVNCIESGCNMLESEVLADLDALIFWIGTTILHEYVHYGDFAQGFEYPGEEGRRFEVKVYGFNVGPGTARLVLDRVND